MLVLTRRVGENVLLILPGGDQRTIVIRIARVNGHYVRLGIDAPEEVHIVREELTHNCQEGDFTHDR
jgi:carbon storage regulator CsrA